MPKLNQIVAIEKGVKSSTYSKVSEAYKKFQKPALFGGISRTYRPKNDDGDMLPPESTRVKRRVEEMLQGISRLMTKQFDATATKDWGNCEARSDVEIDGETVLAQVPVTYLLFLEKQLTDLHTVVGKLPTLDDSEVWRYDSAQDCWVTDPVETTRNKKMMRNHVKAEATAKHPAQVDVYTEDVVVGYWKTIKLSGALPLSRRRDLLERVEKMQEAVKFAREQANSMEVERQKVGEDFFGYLFA
jgi:hypothetical protein